MTDIVISAVSNTAIPDSKTCVVCGAIRAPKRPKTCSPECSIALDKHKKKLYRETNVDQVREYNRQYRLDNLDKCKAASARSRDKYMRSIEFREDKRILLLLRSCRLSAKRKNLEFSLTPELISELILTQSGRCALTGIELNWGFGGEYRANPYAPSIDRKDSRIGYIAANIQVVCYAANLAKNEYPIEIFDHICRARIELLKCQS